MTCLFFGGGAQIQYPDHWGLGVQIRKKDLLGHHGLALTATVHKHPQKDSFFGAAHAIFCIVSKFPLEIHNNWA